MPHGIPCHQLGAEERDTCPLKLNAEFHLFWCPFRLGFSGSTRSSSRAKLNLKFPWSCFISFLTIRRAISYRFILLNPPPRSTCSFIFFLTIPTLYRFILLNPPSTIYLECDLHARPWNLDYKKTGRVRHSRRRKAVVMEERRIKAMRDQPCPADTAEGAEIVVLYQLKFSCLVELLWM
ncbi:hypothetical protein IGI04_010882 [Brassica rapa subsp. trilocularis]|uniref:Uncharacterized protein n=1 Tax=Brassica rapa subsp. trilocularis TaxID=1813537 RepID=A0ABQ7N1G4_BRACM|nr:hypothetical protein IGI04_010882 [Brassica rapa subsp. trilocularis]